MGGNRADNGSYTVTSQSYKVEVIADSSEQWAGNAVRFATRKEAEEYAQDLYLRWTAVRDWRVIESDEPVNRGG